MITALLLACIATPPRSTDPGVSVQDAPMLMSDRLVSFRDAANRAGFTVSDGAFEFLDYERCCLTGASCLWNNPSTPYGLYSLPPAPGQTGLDLDVRDGRSSYFHLRRDEALVLLGRTPPPSKYFSFRSYKALEWRPEAASVLGSLGASTNHLTIGAQRGTEAVYDLPLALVTTLDAGVEAEVHALLLASGFEDEEISDDRIVTELVNPGLEDGDDLFMAVARVAVIEDPEREAAMYDAPSWTLLRLTPDQERGPPIAHDRPVLPERGTGTTEADWQEALDALDAAIVNHYAPLRGIVNDAVPFWFETLTCVEEGFCSGDIRDRWYARVPPFPMPTDDVFAVALGVNHERTGKASYSNVAVDTVANEIGLDSMNSREMIGSASYFLPDHPQSDDLYALVIARNCDRRPEPRCIEVPYGCPGVDPWETLFVSFRAYLEPTTGAAPADDEMLMDRVYWFENLH